MTVLYCWLCQCFHLPRLSQMTNFAGHIQDYPQQHLIGSLVTLNRQWPIHTEKRNSSKCQWNQFLQLLNHVLNLEDLHFKKGMSSKLNQCTHLSSTFTAMSCLEECFCKTAFKSAWCCGPSINSLCSGNPACLVNVLC